MFEDLVGRRVVVRRLVDVSAGRQRYTDVVGHLVEHRGDVLALRVADGTLVTVPVSLVHRIRPVPPRPTRAGPAEILALEEIAARGWPAPEQSWLGRWLLRAGGGFTNRANSVLPLANPDRALAEALVAVPEWYAARGLSARFQIPLPARAELDAELARQGWSATPAALVLTGELTTARNALPARPDLAPVTMLAEPSTRWLTAYCRYRDLDRLPPAALAVLTSPNELIFAGYPPDGPALAIGRGVLDGGWLGLSALHVRPDARRQGLAGHLLAALFEWAVAGGATRCYLQVTTDNTAALTLYDRLGFTTHHRYHYRVAPE